MIFKEKPSEWNAEIQVVACYLQCEGEFLLLQRQPHKTHGNKWGLPAGKVDKGEDLETAVRREIFEETGIESKNLQMMSLSPLWVINNGHNIEYFSFIADLESKPEILLSINEHSAYQWVSPENSLKVDLVHDLEECNRLFFNL